MTVPSGVVLSYYDQHLCLVCFSLVCAALRGSRGAEAGGVTPALCLQAPGRGTKRRPWRERSPERV